MKKIILFTLCFIPFQTVIGMDIESVVENILRLREQGIISLQDEERLKQFFLDDYLVKFDVPVSQEDSVLSEEVDRITTTPLEQEAFDLVGCSECFEWIANFGKTSPKKASPIKKRIKKSRRLTKKRAAKKNEIFQELKKKFKKGKLEPRKLNFGDFKLVVKDAYNPFS